MCTAVPSGLLIRTGVDWFECAGDDVSPGTRSNDGKVQRGRGCETAPFPVFLHQNAKNMQIVSYRY